MTEILDRFAKLTFEESQRGFVMLQNFINLTEAIKNKAHKIIYVFGFPIELPDFYQPEFGLMEALHIVVCSAFEKEESKH